MKHKKKASKRADARNAARRSGKRQTPYPHEFSRMVGYPTAPNDPDHDGDNDAPGQPDADAA